MNIGKNTIVSALWKNIIQAAPFTKYVKIQLDNAQAKAAESRAHGDVAPANSPKVKLDQESIIEILKQIPEDGELAGLKSKLPSEEAELQNLSRVILYQLKAIGLARQGAYGDMDVAESLVDKAHELETEAVIAASKTYQEQIEEAISQNLPKFILAHQAKLKAMNVFLKPLLYDLFCGDYEQFKKTFSPILGGEIPYENLVKFIYEAINKKENDELKVKIQNTIQSLVDRELPDGDDEAAMQWTADLSELKEIIFGKKYL